MTEHDRENSSDSDDASPEPARFVRNRPAERNSPPPSKPKVIEGRADVRMWITTLETHLLRARLRNFISVEQYHTLQTLIKKHYEHGPLWELVGNLKDCIDANNKSKWLHEGNETMDEIILQLSKN
jgi:hypothetical protein